MSYNLNNLYYSIRHDEEENVKKMLASDPEHEKINELFRNHSLLFRLSEVEISEPYALYKFKYARLLLEAGADPFQFQKAYYTRQTTNPFFQAVETHNLGLARMMLFYADAYEELENQTSDASTITGKETVKRVDDAETKQGIHRSFAQCIKETAKEARLVKQLKTKAEEFIEHAQFIQAAQCYEDISKIFSKQIEIENTIAYCKFKRIIKRDHIDATPEEYKPVLKAFYQGQQDLYLQKLYDCYYRIEEELQDHFAHLEKEEKAYHAHVLQRLTDIGQALKQSPQTFKTYAEKMARLALENILPNGRVPESLAHRIFSEKASEAEEESGETQGLLALSSKTTTITPFAKWFTWLMPQISNAEKEKVL